MLDMEKKVSEEEKQNKKVDRGLQPHPLYQQPVKGDNSMSIFIQNKYRKIYLKIINRARSEKRVKLSRNHPDYIYYENHHILPKVLWPQFKNLNQYSWNGILLTMKEHFICHALLPKFTEGKSRRHMNSALSAFMKMNNPGKSIITARRFEVARKAAVQAKVGKPCSEVTKAKIRKSLKGRKQLPRSDEYRENIRQAKLGKPGHKWTDEQRENMSKARKGKKKPPRSPEHCAKISANMKKRSKKPVY